MNVYDYLDADLRVFGLYGFKNGQCDCGNEECAAIGKHPRASNWQHTPQWSEEQIDAMDEAGYFASGFGVLVSGLLIVDVDARNGGVESYERLCSLIPAIKDSGFVVATGSGGGSKHVYFSLPECAPLMQTHHDFVGIDFKSSGYVVGAGSLHASGAEYEKEHGHPDDITPAPAALVELLRKPDFHRAVVDGNTMDVSDADLRDMLAHISPNCGHDQWIRIGMALHHATGGSSFELWDDWSSGGDSYPSSDTLYKRWQSLGKSPTPTTLGTIIHYAKLGGWNSSVEFTPSVTFDIPDDTPPSVDLLRPPGFVGDVCQWINDQCLYPREHLAVAAALMAVSNIAGMRHVDEMDGMTPNMIGFCVAGSGSGKDAVLKAYSEILRVAGMAPALYGSFKSEQEIYRNLLRHQPALYLVDELGIQLNKIVNGKSDYLTGIIGTIMSAYSKADSFLPITGDLKEEIRARLQQEYGAVKKMLDTGAASPALEAKEQGLIRQLETIDQGIDAPYMSIMGFTTPATFDSLFTFEQATNGFLARATIFREHETNPKRRKHFKKRAMPMGLEMAIASLRSGGSAGDDAGRIEHVGEKIQIPTTDDARALLDDAYEYFWELAETHKDGTGLEAIPRRGYEMAAKVSLILALPEGLRTAEHVTWAVELAKKDIGGKLLLAHGNASEDDTDRMAAKIISVLSKDEPTTEGVIKNRIRSYAKENGRAVLDKLAEVGHVVAIDTGKTRAGKPVMHYFAP